MKVIECPSCGSKNVDVVSGNVCKCKECNTVFMLDGIQAPPPANAMSTSQYSQLANPMNLQEGSYKICSHCKVKIPKGATRCPCCGRRPWSLLKIILIVWLAFHVFSAVVGLIVLPLLSHKG